MIDAPPSSQTKMINLTRLFDPSLLLILFSCFTLPSICCPQHQKQALLHFKASLMAIDGTDLRAFSSWNSSSDCCHWERVTCSSISAAPHVVVALSLSSVIGSVSTDVLGPLFSVRSLESLDISNNEIEGEIPGSGLANLTQLVELFMGGNRINGSLPPQLFYLRNLRILSFSVNSLSGEIPTEISNLTNLEELDLYYNSISGVIPPQLFQLKKLRILDLSWNSFHGEILTGVANLTDLQQLWLGNNNFSGVVPAEMSHLSKLEILDLWTNSFHGEIPMEIGNLTSLQQLYLSENNFSGEIPRSLRKLENLTDLVLDKNKLWSEITWFLEFQFLSSLYLGGNNLSWGNLSMVSTNISPIQFLWLQSCNLEGEIPFWLSKLDLQLLNLGSNHLQGNLSDYLAEMSNLYYLDFSGNMFIGSIPPSLIQLKGLQYLDLSFNALSGMLPDNISEAADLVWLNVASNKLSGQVPTAFPPLISVLELCRNEFSGVIPQNLTDLSNLIYLDLHSNNITGEIPRFRYQNRLYFLNLGNNSLQGTIPESLYTLENLQVLDLSSNQLSGIVPETIGKLSGMIDDPDSLLTILSNKAGIMFPAGVELPNMEVFWKEYKQSLHNVSIYTILDLSNNQLSGEIPDSVSSLKSLKLLNMSRNKLSGRIPDSFGGLTDMESLDLSHNNLSGEIPRSFGKLLQLTVLELSNNRLTGEIPNGPQMDRMNDPNSYANNSGLCGMQISVPCEKAEPPKAVEEDDKRREKEWFSWETAGIGYSCGSLLVVLALHSRGYFNVAAQMPFRRRHGWFYLD